MSNAAPPLLASTLLSSLINSSREQDDSRRRKTVGTGCKAIDEQALEGGFDYGAVTAVSGGVGTGKTLLSMHTIASHLLQQETSQAAIIDTTRHFDLHLLLHVVASRLNNSGNAAKQYSGEHGGYEAALGRAERLLDRVLFMDVFDFVGLVDAVNEIRGKLEGQGGKGEVEEGGMKKVDEKEDEDKGEEEKQASVGGEIADSEDEEGDQDDLVEPIARPATAEMVEEPAKESKNTTKVEDIGLIIIDNITNIFSPIMARNQTEGHGLLLNFARTLTHLTRTHNICTLLLNDAITPRSFSQNPIQHPHQDLSEENFLHQHYRRKVFEDEQVSVFACTLSKPALGKSFGYCVDLHVFLSRIEKGGGGEDKEEMVGVCEVLKDREGGRQGMWGGFVLDGVRIKNAL
ncbi:MAG: hypothetical protein M1836_007435 [Candelina mexicana]|nr:MAG: hypothetical protein M1836_007435 [Candelina mexicana]